MVMDITSEAAMELKVWKLREWFVPFLKTDCRKASLKHKIRQHIDGQLRASGGMVFENALTQFCSKRFKLH